ncbi:TetR/AcrR family transcriptional regulator [Archangium violaceum]|uniref:TetR/AcrR family transcriptional regulator n=1 Tax=Archangium violaceum TaxID=83451 RepID=UPI002B32049A|nr:TetR/AcrR family transcriptional regulator [Archangium violaceum]
MAPTRSQRSATQQARPTRGVPEKEEAIVQAMLELVAEHGFHGTSTDMIASRAGVGAGTIYRYFATKDELILRVYDRIKGDGGSQIFKGDDLELPLRERLRRVWRNTAQALLTQRSAFFFLEQFYNSPYVKQVPPETLERFARPMGQLLEAAVRAQVVREMSQALFEALFFAPVMMLVRMHHLGQVVLDDSLLERTFEGCWNAIRN